MAEASISLSKELLNNQSVSVSWVWQGGGNGWYSSSNGSPLSGEVADTISLPEKYGKIKSGKLTYKYTFYTSRATFSEGIIQLVIAGPQENIVLYKALYDTTASETIYTKELDDYFLNQLNNNKPSSITCGISVSGKVSKPSNPASTPNQGSTQNYTHAVNGKILSLTLVIEYSSGLIHYWNGSQWVEGELKYWNGTEWVDGAELKYWNGNEWVEVE